MSNRKDRKLPREFFLLKENSYFCRDKETNGSVYKGSLVEFVKHELKRVVQIPKTGTFVRSTSYGPYNSYGSEDSSDSDISGHKRRSQAGSGSNQGQRKCIQEILYCNLGKGMDSQRHMLNSTFFGLLVLKNPKKKNIEAVKYR